MRNQRSLALVPFVLCLGLSGLAAPALAAPQQDDVPSEQEARTLLDQGRFEEAAEAFRQRAEANPDDATAHFMYAYSIHMAGDLDAAHEAHLEAARFDQLRATALYNHACVHALRNEKDEAFTALKEAVEAGFDNAEQLRTDSDMDSLREDGRFQAILLSMRGTDPTKLTELPPARLFDFYVGDWEMRDGDQAERRLSVEHAFDGRGLEVVSHRVPGGAEYARSLFLYDADDEVWRQVWFASDGTIVTLAGGLEDGAIVLRMASENGEAQESGRSVFRDVAADRFEYEWQERQDGEWRTVSRRTFVRRSS